MLGTGIIGKYIVIFSACILVLVDSTKKPRRKMPVDRGRSSAAKTASHVLERGTKEMSIDGGSYLITADAPKTAYTPDVFTFFSCPMIYECLESKQMFKLAEHLLTLGTDDEVFRNLVVYNFIPKYIYHSLGDKLTTDMMESLIKITVNPKFEGRWYFILQELQQYGIKLSCDCRVGLAELVLNFPEKTSLEKIDMLNYLGYFKDFPNERKEEIIRLWEECMGRKNEEDEEDEEDRMVLNILYHDGKLLLDNTKLRLLELLQGIPAAISEITEKTEKRIEREYKIFVNADEKQRGLEHKRRLLEDAEKNKRMLKLECYRRMVCLPQKEYSLPEIYKTLLSITSESGSLAQNLIPFIPSVDSSIPKSRNLILSAFGKLKTCKFVSPELITPMFIYSGVTFEMAIKILFEDGLLELISKPFGGMDSFMMAFRMIFREDLLDRSNARTLFEKLKNEGMHSIISILSKYFKDMQPYQDYIANNIALIIKEGSEELFDSNTYRTLCELCDTKNLSTYKALCEHFSEYLNALLRSPGYRLVVLCLLEKILGEGPFFEYVPDSEIERIPSIFSRKSKTPISFDEFKDMTTFKTKHIQKKILPKQSSGSLKSTLDREPDREAQEDFLKESPKPCGSWTRR